MDLKDEPTAHPIETPKKCVQSPNPAITDSVSSRVKSLERELALLTRVSRNTQEALKEALDMTAELREANAKMNEALTVANAENVKLVQIVEAQQRNAVEAAMNGERFIRVYYSIISMWLTSLVVLLELQSLLHPKVYKQHLQRQSTFPRQYRMTQSNKSLRSYTPNTKPFVWLRKETMQSMHRTMMNGGGSGNGYAPRRTTQRTMEILPRPVRERSAVAGVLPRFAESLPNSSSMRIGIPKVKITMLSIRA